jgi:hypothetical protein
VRGCGLRLTHTPPSLLVNLQFSIFNFPFSIASAFSIALLFDDGQKRSRREAIENGKLKNEN